MGIVFACIAPHAAETIPQLAGDKLEAFNKTREGMKKIAKLVRKLKVDTLVVATPHNVRLWKRIGVVTTEFSEGELKTESGSIRARFSCNRQLAREVLRLSEELKLPVIGVDYGTAEGAFSCMPMDWGSLIPLWFLGLQSKKPRAVLVTPSREIPMDNLVKFGSLIAEAADNLEERTGFVASADHAHTHALDGPYGFSPTSVEFDQLVRKAVEENNLRELLNLEPELVEAAKPDSLWQIAILVGILDRVPLRGRLLSYQAPTYFGMLCAAYTPR